MRDMGRAAVYALCDHRGAVDAYVLKMLSALSAVCDHTLVGHAGPLSEEDRKRLLCVSSRLLQADAACGTEEAYRAGVRALCEAAARPASVLLCADTLMGPVCPLDALLKGAQGADVFALTMLPDGDGGRIELDFCVLGRKALDAEALWEAGDTGLAGGIAASGLACASLLPPAAPDISPLLLSPVELLRDHGCPFFSRQAFTCDYGMLLDYTNARQGAELHAYLRRTGYDDLDGVWARLLRTENHGTLRGNMALHFILPDMESSGAPAGLSCALMMHIYYPDKIGECLRYARAMPEGADIYLTTDTDEKKRAIEQALLQAGMRATVLRIENRGRDVGALLVGLRPYVARYDAVCFAHDKKVAHMDVEATGNAFAFHCFENTLRSRPFVENVLRAFESNPRLGLLTPPPPSFSHYFNTLGIHDWGINYEPTRALLRQMGWDLPVDEAIPPVAPFGTIFWFRPKALAPLYQKGWRYEDFPGEPIPYDGTLLHAVERAYPFAAQQAGYYSAWLHYDGYAQIEAANQHYMLRTLNRRLFVLFHADTLRTLLHRLATFGRARRRLFVAHQLYRIKRVMPRRWYDAIRRAIRGTP